MLDRRHEVVAAGNDLLLEAEQTVGAAVLIGEVRVAHPGSEDEFELGGDAARKGDEEQTPVETCGASGYERVATPEYPPVDVLGATGVALPGMRVDGDVAVRLVSLEGRRLLDPGGVVAEVQEGAGELDRPMSASCSPRVIRSQAAVSIVEERTTM